MEKVKISNSNKNKRKMKIYRNCELCLSSFSLGFRRNRCKILLQLSDNNCVTLDVELRV